MYLVIKVKGFNGKSRPYARSYGCYKQRDEDSKNESRGNVETTRTATEMKDTSSVDQTH